MIRKPQPSSTAPKHGLVTDQRWIEKPKSREQYAIKDMPLLEVQPNKKSPAGKRMPPSIMGGNLASGTGRMLFASSFLTKFLVSVTSLSCFVNHQSPAC